MRRHNYAIICSLNLQGLLSTLDDWGSFQSKPAFELLIGFNHRSINSIVKYQPSFRVVLPS